MSETFTDLISGDQASRFRSIVQHPDMRRVIQALRNEFLVIDPVYKTTPEAHLKHVLDYLERCDPPIERPPEELQATYDFEKVMMSHGWSREMIRQAAPELYTQDG